MAGLLSLEKPTVAPEESQNSTTIIEKLKVQYLKLKKENCGRMFSNKRELEKQLNYLVNGNYIFENDTSLAPLNCPPVKKCSAITTGASIVEKIQGYRKPLKGQ